jgi:hypothetical protein
VSFGWASQPTREGCLAEAMRGPLFIRSIAKADRKRLNCAPQPFRRIALPRHEMCVVYAGGRGMLAGAAGLSAAATPAPVVPVNLWPVFLVFAKAGAVLFGRGYMRLAILPASMVKVGGPGPLNAASGSLQAAIQPRRL